MGEVSTHTFTKGMNQDLDKSMIDNQTSFEIRNFRLNTSDGGSTAVLENIEGTYNSFYDLTETGTISAEGDYIVYSSSAIYNSIDYTRGDTITITDPPTMVLTEGRVIAVEKMVKDGHSIIGSINIRNQVILFSTDNTNSCIYKATMNTNEEDGRFASFERIYDDDYNGAGGGSLDFNTANPITGIGRYEIATIKKIYWVDGSNNVRYCNIEDNLTANGEIFIIGVNLYFPVDRFEFIPNSVLPKVVLADIVGGEIETGVIQYTYQMYIKHGSETAFAPLSNVIHVVKEDDFLSHSNDYRGSKVEEFAGKGFKITIDNSGNSAFNNVRIIALHRKTINDIPTIRIAAEIAIDESTNSIIYVDVGNSVGELILEELAIPDTNLFKAGALETKDNLLFAGDIDQNPFKVSDWDARTYRFNSSQISRINEASGYYYLIYNAGVIREGAGGEASLGDWEYFNSSDVYQSINGSNWSIPETADCINPFNDPDGEPFAAADAYKYTAAGSAWGAQGKNLSITIGYETFDITDKTNVNYTGVSVESVSDNKSYKDFASPWRAGQERSWQRDEAYRLGLVFYDDKMRKSQVLWSNDLKIPCAYTIPLIIAGTPVQAKIVYPNLKMNNLPTNAVYYQLCRVQRGSADRSVLAQGLANRVGQYPYLANAALSNGDTKFKIISPEPTINRNLTARSTDYVEYLGAYGAPDNSGTAGTDNEVIWKAVSLTPVLKAANHKVTVDNIAILPPSEDIVTIGGVSVGNYIHTHDAYGGTALFVEATLTTWVPGVVGTAWVHVNYRRNVFNSQYGGNTYEVRTTNEYIPASDVSSTTGEWVKCKIGDTFITYFEYLNFIWDLTKEITTPAGQSLHEVVFIPVESSINCNLRHDFCHSDTYSGSHNELLQEFAGTHEEAGGQTFNQLTDLYQYNTVYSEENDIVKFFALPYDYTSVNEYDTRVKVSNIKINGETTDSWTKFNVNEYIDVDSVYGSLNNLHLFKNHLMFFQDTGFGRLSVSERSLISDNNPGELVLGTGGVLDRFDYVSKNVGNKQKLGLIESANSLYWFYDNEKTLYRYSQSEMPLSKLKGMQSWFNDIFRNEDTLVGVYDDKYNEVIFTFQGEGNQEPHTIAYNEMFDVFSGFYDFTPTMYIKLTNNRYVSTTDNWWLFYHNYEGRGLPTDSRATFYFNAASYSTVKFLVTDNYLYTKVFDNINYLSTATSLTVQDYYNSTFNRLRVFNDYQNSDWIVLTPGTNLERRERNWTLNVPRDIVKIKEEANTDIFLAGNLDDAQKFKKRMRDKYMQIELDYYNTNHHRFIVPLINTKYRISYR